MNIFVARIEDDKGFLTAEESWHCAKVLRKKSGDKICLIDGAGSFYDGVLELVNEKQCVCRVMGEPLKQKERGFYLHLAIAPTKQIDRIEWMLEKAVEMGIDEISFFVSKNSERTVVKKDRLDKIVESAVKQSLQARIPKVNEAVPLKKLLPEASEEQKFIAHCFPQQKTDIRAVQFKNKRSLFLVGPEGDFTKDEVAEAEQFGFKAISLGENRLRTETAGLYICQAASILTL